jgi:predicted O-methyltransferase YrrM
VKNIVNILDNPKYGAEIGVYKGETSKLLLETFPDLILYMVDIWEGENVGKDIYADESAYEATLNNVAPFGGRAIIIRADSVGVSKHIKDGSLDFVFIDAAHDYDSVKKDIEAWYPKVRKGGLVTGHDYNKIRFPGVVRAVDERFGGDIEIFEDGKHYQTNGNLSIWVHRKR